MIELPVKINVLGTTYIVGASRPDEDKNLDNVDAYCDHTTKRIVVNNDYIKGATIGNPEYYMKKVLRHEIIHAFMYESGLDEQATFDDEHFEQMVDWIAIQHEKLHAIYEQLEILGD